MPSFWVQNNATRITSEIGTMSGNRMPTISFVVKNQHSEKIVLHMDQLNIGIRFGDFYAKRLIAALGLVEQGGVVRVSIAHYNTVEEIDRLIRGLDEVIR